MINTKQRVFITGGSGFLGACLTRSLLADGAEVHLLLRPGSRWRLAGLEGAYAGHDGDLTDAASLRRAIRASRPDVVFHLGAAGVPRGPVTPQTIQNTNHHGTANLLVALEDHPYRALVHAGSASEYGPSQDAIAEDAPVRPETDYARAKAAAAALCLAAGRRGLPVVVVRIFSAYGCWEAPNRLVPHVMSCCARGERPQLTAGWQRRDFIHSDDVVALLRRAADTPEAAGQVLHAGTGRAHSVREFVSHILAVCGRPQLEPIYGAEVLRQGEPERYVAAIERTTALTGWRPRLDVRQGLERSWDWFQEHGERVA